LPARSKIGSSGAAERKAREPAGEGGGSSERIQTAPAAMTATEKAMVKSERGFMGRGV
jgi:hypothetical protein